MEDWLIHQEGVLRLGFFIGALLVLGVWENIVPWRQSRMTRKVRWLNHLLLVSFSTFLIRVLFPVLTLAVAVKAGQQNLGLWRDLPLPFFIQIILGVLSLDLVIYAQHRMFHRVPLLWRIHRVHHVDQELDVTTGVRFHPLELIISMGIKLMAIVFFGVPVLAVFIFEVLLNFCSLFTHTNIRLSPKVDKVLRTVVVTPPMHRVHHSDIPMETQSNFGFCFSFWDKLLSTYHRVSLMGERNLIIGLEDFQTYKYQKFWAMLWFPFEGKKVIMPGQRKPVLKKVALKSQI